MDLDECFSRGLVKKTRIDEDLIKSLIEMSDITEKTTKSIELNEETISVIVSNAYDSLREILEAICISNGYKVLSHICLGELLTTLLKEFDYTEFDRVRYVRNGINYYGTKVDFEQGKEIINKIFAMRKQLIENYLKDFT